jgi:membrane protease subunit HflC
MNASQFTARRIAIATIGFLVLMLLWGAVFNVDQTELANVRRFGTVLYPRGEPLASGLHFKLPLVDTVDRMQVTLRTLHIPPFEVLTIDNQKVTIEENFNYTIGRDQFYHVMYEVGRAEDINIDDQVIPVVRDRTARIFAAQNMVTVNGNREAIQADIEKHITVAVESLFGITAHSLQIAAITPSAAFMASIDQATMAKNVAIAAENELRTKQFQAQQVVTTAKGAADARILQAEAEARAIQIQGEAQAAAIKAQADALAANTKLIQLRIAEKWDGRLPMNIYANAPIPFLPIEAGPSK